MTDEPESIFTTADHCQHTGKGVEVCVARDDAGRVTLVGIINEGDAEMVELDPVVALAAARAIVASLEGHVGVARHLH